MIAYAFMYPQFIKFNIISNACISYHTCSKSMAQFCGVVATLKILQKDDQRLKYSDISPNEFHSD